MHIIEILGVYVLDSAPPGGRRRPERQGRVERPVGRFEIAPHVQGRDALTGRYDVEPAGVGLRQH